jgi:glucokinase
VGGTKTNVGLYEPRGGVLRLVEFERFASAEHSGLESILTAFVSAHPARLRGCAAGIAGPVLDGRSVATNLPWVVDARKLARRLRTSVTLVNDLEATAHAIPALKAESLLVLNRGREVPMGNYAILAAGTGLGEAFVIRSGGDYHVGASEGGHRDFAPRNAGEMELLRYLMERYGHVSVERVLSGHGLVNVYEFIGAMGWKGEAPGVNRRLLKEDKAAVISTAALDGTSPRAAEALRQFAAIYGAEAGNLALTYFATGGVYIGGGIAPKILPALHDGRFLEAFLDKGRFRDFLRAIPVKVILDERASMLGAAHIASARTR